jgi:broad specificity phosphatase PhoE
MAASIILVRHSQPVIDPALPAPQWNLSAEGRSSCFRLAEKLRQFSPAVIVTSMEKKAIQTGELLAESLHIPAHPIAGLEEHARTGLLLQDQAHFEALVAQFFAHPAELVLGQETAGQALQRFSEALITVLAGYPDQSIVVVTHGTVISLWASQQSGCDAFTFWKTLRMPCALVFSRPEFRSLEPMIHVD